MSLTILGVDPGSLKTGFGILNAKGNELNYIYSGCIYTGKSTDPLANRLLVIYNSLEKIIHEFQPQVLAIEESFLARNVQATIKLSEARAVAMVCARKAELEVFEYTPTQIKQAVVGYGVAQKQQVQYMVQQLLSLDKSPQEDAADALACAICHAFTHRLNHILNRV